jgi:hypothetical protein
MDRNGSGWRGRGRDRAGEAYVRMDSVYPQHRGLAIGGGVDLADQPVVVEDGQCEEPPAPLGLRLVHLQIELELEQFHGADPIVDQPVERRQQCGASFESAGGRLRIDPP